MKKLVYLISLTSLSLIFSCNKNTDSTSKLLIDTVSMTRYYSNEVLQNTNLKLYGKWKLIKMCGGIAGGCNYPLSFDYLELKNYGIYGLIKNDTVIQLGKIEVLKQTIDTFCVSFIPDKIANDEINSFRKYVYFTGNNSFDLDEDFFDSFGLFFNRIK